MPKLRVIIADNFAPFLQTLCSLLSGKYDIVATASSGYSALEAIRDHKPDVAVLDLDMPGLSGIAVTQELAADSQRPRVVICSTETDSDVINAAQQVGAVYVAKVRLATELIPALNGQPEERAA